MFEGSMVALATPMDTNGNVDYDALARLVEFQIAYGTDALVAVGTTGESATLDHQEHADVIRHVVKFANRRLPVIAGTGANSTREAIDLSLAAMSVGADACLHVTPYYNRPTQHGLIAHFGAIAESVDLPIILYNVPARTACDLLPKTVAELSAIPNVIGIKEATGEIGRIEELIERCDPTFSIYSGEDWMGLDTLLAGARGVISVTANVAPGLMRMLCERALAGDSTGARIIDEALQPLHKALFVESNPIPTKWALQEMGLIGPGIRLPLTSLSREFHDRIRRAMHIANTRAACESREINVRTAGPSCKSSLRLDCGIFP